jgi:phosphoribosylglycinamide formyltransferase-1
MKNIAVFVSGGGTNLQNLIDSCENGYISGKIKLVVADNSSCYGLARAKNHEIDTHIIERTKDPSQRDRIQRALVDDLKAHEIDFIVLAGYLSIVSGTIIEEFKNKIINIHPSLIPKYCGKGYYGDRIHEEVIKNSESETGITIHYVDEGIDTGKIILQEKLSVLENDTVDSLASRIHELEYKNLREVVKGFCE